MKQFKDQAIAETEERLKQARKERSQEAERDVQRSLRDRRIPYADRVISKLTLFGEKITTDIEEQFAFVEELRASVPVTPSRYAEVEISRLLRMLEKRKELIDQLQMAMVFDETLAAQISAVEARSNVNEAEETRSELELASRPN